MEDVVDLRRYIRILWRHWRLIGSAAVAGGLIAAGLTVLVPREYEATAVVSVAQTVYSIRFDNPVSRPTLPNKSYPELALSDAVIAEVFTQAESELPADVVTQADLKDRLSVEPGADPSLIKLSVRAGEPAFAARAANLWAQVLVSRAGQLLGQDASNLATYEAQAAVLQAHLDQAEKDLAAFQAGNQAGILRAQLGAQQGILADHWSRLHTFDLLMQDAADLLNRLDTQDPEAPASLADDLAVLALSTRSSGGQAVPVQLQLAAGQSASGRRVADEVATLKLLMAGLQARQAEVGAQIAQVEPDIVRLQGLYAEADRQEGALTRQRDLARQDYMGLASKIEDVRISVQEFANTVQVASTAAAPTRPAGPSRWALAALSALAGLFVGSVFVLTREWWRSS